MTRIYLHSHHTDFAPTQHLSERAYLGRYVNGELKFRDCRCGLPRLERIRRTAWMRLLPFLRLYRCRRCHARVLRGKVAGTGIYPLPHIHKR